MSRWITLALGAIVLAFVALVAACSDDDDQAQQLAQAGRQEQEQQAAQPAQAQQQGQQQEQRQQQAAAQAADDAEDFEPLQIVASTQVVADWVRQVGGDRVEVRALVPAGADAHTVELTVDDIRAIAGSDLVVINGAGLEAAYEDVILENADRVLDLAEAIEAKGFELAPFSGMMEGGHDDHGDEHDDHEGDHDARAVGRLLIADAIEAHLSVIGLERGDIMSAQFDVAAPNATVYPSPTHRYGIVLARGPEDDDDRIHVFDGGIYLVEHGDHYDLFRGQMARHPLEIAEEAPIHYVNSHGWTAIFADASGHVILINEEALSASEGDYEPIVLEAGPQHGAALAISDEHIIVTTKNPDDPDDVLPVGVEVWTLDGDVVYNASNGSCPGMHGESHNEHGAAFGCVGGVLFLHAHDGEYEHEWIPNPPEMHEAARIGSVYGQHHLEHFFGSASYRGEAGWNSDGIWLIDVAYGTMTRVFDDATLSVAIGHHGETLYLLGADAVLYALDAHDGELIASAEMVGRGEAGSPRMIAVGELLYITDPGDGHVLAVDGESLEVVDEWHVGGAPSSLAFIGVLDANAPNVGHDDHDDEEGHDDHGDEEDGHHHHHHGDEDPHFWFDTDAASLAVEAIADTLTTLAPESSGVFADRLALYTDAIADADAEVRSLLADLSDEQRLLVTFHDAFAYFASRYGLTVAGFLIEGPEQGVSAADLTALIELIEHEGVETIFHEPQFDASIFDAVSDETGAARGIIWSQPTDDQPTYLDILLANARAIANQ